MSRHRTGFFTVRRIARLLLAIMTAGLTVLPSASASASTNAGPGGPGNFGDGNIPAGCEDDMDPTKPQWWPTGGGGLTTDAWSDSLAVCHHQRTGQNYLDSPQIDVLIMLPVTEPERSLRIARQSVEMWEAGIDYLAAGMDMDWLADGVDFHITVDQVDVGEADGDGEFTTYPIVDPEIVVVMGVNPAGTLGIGITPVSQNICHGVANPFDIDTWEALPGFDSHHETRGGIYNEDCNGSGGDICFAVNTTGDTSVLGWDSMFDLVSHEIGHCLSIGHVGDGAEGGWGGLPPDDIMAYADGVAGTSCVSTLNVESFAIRMSGYLDANGDGVVDAADQLVANDATGGGHKDDNDPFQVMHPRDYRLASSTGNAIDCPQPDLGLLPGPRTQWTPVATETSFLTVSSPAEGEENLTGTFDVTGSVSHANDPTATAGSYDDADDDATTPFSEILNFDVEITSTDVEAVIAVELLTPGTDGSSAATYTLVVDDWSVDSFVYGIGFGEPRAYDANGAHDDLGWTSWDVDNGLVSFRIPRDYLATNGVTAPYQVRAEASLGNGILVKTLDDQAPDANGSIGLAAPGASSAAIAVHAPLASQLQTVIFEDPDGNTFYSENSDMGAYREIGLANPYAHTFQLAVPNASDVEFTMSWTNGLGTETADDIDLYISGAADSGLQGATASQPEMVSLENVQGNLTIEVNPYLITDGVFGTTYVLSAEITELQPADGDGDGVTDATDLCPTEFGVAPTGCPDEDGDGVIDAEDQCLGEPGVAPTGCPDDDGDGVINDNDACPQVFGTGPDGCPVVFTDEVRLFVDGILADSQAVDTNSGPDTFAFTVNVADGDHVLLIEWVEGGNVLATATRNVVHTTDDDGDGVDNDADVCPGFDDTADFDGDGTPDDCDGDVDGDGVDNGSDQCPGFDDAVDVDADGMPDGCDDVIEADTDLDGVGDEADNCPGTANADQADLDEDGIGDACDGDRDGDGVDNADDVCDGFDDAIDVNENGTPDGCETDTTPPLITASILQTPTAEGWYRTNVRVNYTCSDDLSEVADCPGYYIFVDEGVDQSHSVTVHDAAGNATTLEVTGINIDRTGPVITVDGDGVTTTGEFVTGTVTDNFSGVKSVLVIFKEAGGGKAKQVYADLTCAEPTSCTWSVQAPAGLPWTTRARATDMARNDAERVDWTHFTPKTPKALN